MGVFIDIQIEQERLSAEHRRTLVTLCPVEIFLEQDNRLVALPDRLDECTLCGLCLQRAPEYALRIIRTYVSEILISNGESDT